jgi:hypothetical protein
MREIVIGVLLGVGAAAVVLAHSAGGALDEAESDFYDSPQGERVLDLTPRAGSEAGQLTVREEVDCRGRGTGRIGPAPSLTVTIVGLDSREYSMGGQFAVDIRVKNVGKAPVVLPSVLTQDFGGGFSLPPYAIEASLGIEGIDAEGREHTLSGTILRGSPSRYGTTETLKPGESLTIRFPGWILLVDGPSAPATGKAELFATLSLSDNECRSWQAVKSQRLEIWLRGRE